MKLRSSSKRYRQTTKSPSTVKDDDLRKQVLVRLLETSFALMVSGLPRDQGSDVDQGDVTEVTTDGIDEIAEFREVKAKISNLTIVPFGRTI
jgi:hypothetical protein